MNAEEKVFAAHYSSLGSLFSFQFLTSSLSHSDTDNFMEVAQLTSLTFYFLSVNEDNSQLNMNRIGFYYKFYNQFFW